jgi:uncharacterized membrane protein
MESTTYGGGQGRAVDAGRGVTWWSEGWALFMKNAGISIVISLIMCVITFVLAIIPFLGSLALSLLFPVFIGSWMLIARKLETGGTPEIGDLFLGFKDKLTPLITIGGLVLVATIVLMVVFMVLGMGGAMFGAAAGGSRGGMMAGFGAAAVMMLIGLAYGVVVGMALFYAPALVVFQDMPAIDAMKTSFAAGLKNIVAFLIFGVLYFIAAIIASIPLGLGWLVLVPVLLFAAYRSYIDVFSR